MLMDKGMRAFMNVYTRQEINEIHMLQDYV